ncbi:Abi-alpha family protein [Mucilaginibacter psychrotolerans]|uniref:DUF4393 domain-containing protein n=1 Tax=Mucilaginibacter psychrotolerans TaxID=1524096 RepID=A0A4Y8S995_9SPHI|nr:Abi-alpha family protein [Mucilaginibacter psychrotolerans]TFF35190.1 DUF4393 domain-containing protein [Mucilaginibacter psychrotolerans]
MGDLNLKSTTIEKSLDVASGLFNKLFGSVVEELSLRMTDNLKMFRLKNQIRNFKKIEKIVADNNITMRQINLKALVPYLEAVGLEEEESLQEAWANLMSNYIDSSKNLISHVYPDVLKQLSSNELALLEFIIVKTDLNTFTVKQFTEEEIGNVTRLNLIEERMRNDGGRGILSSNIAYPSGIFFPTRFGKSFYQACRIYAVSDQSL